MTHKLPKTVQDAIEEEAKEAEALIDNSNGGACAICGSMEDHNDRSSDGYSFTHQYDHREPLTIIRAALTHIATKAQEEAGKELQHEREQISTKLNLILDSYKCGGHARIRKYASALTQPQE